MTSPSDLSNNNPDEILSAPGGRLRRSQTLHTESVIQREGKIAMDGNEIVLTPGGYRHKSLVHKIESGTALVVRGREFLQSDLRTKKETLLSKSFLDEARQLTLGEGWITLAYWQNGTGRPVSALKTTFVVPPAPAVQANPLQTIFVFPGIQSGSIIQPVLQWGSTHAGGGPNWAIASWYVGPRNSGQAAYTDLVQVSTGDVLVGSIALISSGNGKFNYSCEFEGVPATKLMVQDAPELTLCVQAMESYQVQDCANYPSADLIRMSSITIEIDNKPTNVHWTPRAIVVDCGQHTVLPNQSEVDLFFRAETP